MIVPTTWEDLKNFILYFILQLAEVLMPTPGGA